jgi:hypothetical protein
MQANAIEILNRAAQHMKDRAATYDSPEGERSMGKVVQMFNICTGRDITESEGWLLMILLKWVRVFQNTNTVHVDGIEDAVAYSALFGECAMKGVDDD